MIQDKIKELLREFRTKNTPYNIIEEKLGALGEVKFKNLVKDIFMENMLKYFDSVYSDTEWDIKDINDSNKILKLIKI